MPNRCDSFVLGCLAFCSPLIAFAAGAPAPFAPPQAGEMSLFQGATLIDGTGAVARANVDVLVDGERIQSIAPHGDLNSLVTTKTRRIDLSGRYLMPGLIDAHVHMATPPNRRQAEALLRRDLYGGVTAVRDMADDLRSVGDITRASRVGEIAGPDVYYAALMAGPDFFTDKRTALTSQGAVNGQVPWMRAITEQSDLPLAVAEAHGTSATAIKLYADLNGELAAKITAEAHRQHMLVWAHATLYPARPSEVIAAGVDTISHACLLVRESAAQVPRLAEFEQSPRPPLDEFAKGDSPALAKVFTAMVQRGTILDATVWVYGTGTLPIPPGRCDDHLGGVITGQAYRAGVAIAAGTDGVMPSTDRWPELFHELAALQAGAGMPVVALLHSATVIGARAVGQERDMGSLEQGKLANMVVLTRNPLERLDNLKSIVMTVKRGRIFRRSELKPLVKADITDLD